jgi:hypothetical protein
MQLKDETGDIRVPRYEFRIFGSDLSKVHARLEKLASFSGTRYTADIYLLSRLDEAHIIKIREQKLDIKKLLRVDEGFEQWDPIIKQPFPVSESFLVSIFFPALGVKPPDRLQRNYTMEAFMSAVEKHPDIETVKVDKRRQSYNLNGSHCETAEVTIGNARLSSICCEASLLDNVKRCVQRLDIERYANTNYPRAIKRMIGMGE